MPEDRIKSSLESVWDYPHPHTLGIEVQPEHIDGLLHTNNTVYIGWCEQVAWNHSASLGLDLERYQALNRAMAITHCEYDYLQASREGDRLIAGTWNRGLGQAAKHETLFPDHTHRGRRYSLTW